MFAIVDIQGQQFKVRKDQELFVHRIDAEVGNRVDFTEVLLIHDPDNGTKLDKLGGTAVHTTVLEHLKGDKVIVFKKKRRKGYKKRNGHRQYLTKIRVDEIFV